MTKPKIIFYVIQIKDLASKKIHVSIVRWGTLEEQREGILSVLHQLCPQYQYERFRLEIKNLTLKEIISHLKSCSYTLTIRGELVTSDGDTTLIPQKGQNDG